MRQNMIFAASALALAACSGSPDPDSSAVATKRTTDDAVHPRTPPELSGTITQRALGAPNDIALADVQACLLTLEGPLCIPSGADGGYTIGPFAPYTSARVLYAKSGFVPVLADYDIREHSVSANVFLLTDDVADSIAAARGKTHVPGGSAGLAVAAWSIGLEGIAPLEGVSASSVGVSVVFADAENQLQPELTRTSSSAWGAAFGLEPGHITIEFLHSESGARCGWITGNGTIETSFDVYLQAGSATLLNVYCYG